MSFPLRSPLALRRRFNAVALCALLAGAGLPGAPARAQSLERRVEVRLAAAGETRAFEDLITEYESVLYALTLQPGESVRISLTSANAANCFDIHAPGSAKPVYSGGDSGNDYTLVPQAAGEYIVRVYLLRFAARDGQSARYTLELRRAA